MGLHITKIAKNHVLICLMRTLETIHDTPLEQEEVYRKIIKLHSYSLQSCLRMWKGGELKKIAQICANENEHKPLIGAPISTRS